MDDEHKNLLALLNGLVRREYYGECDLTNEFLKEQIYSDINDDIFAKILHKAKTMLNSMATSNMNMNQAEAFVTSQAKKKEAAITEDQAKVFLRFWKNHRVRVHESLIKQCTWNNRLKNMSWRIDMKNRARHTEELNEPSAIVELQLENTREAKSSEVVRFEMDEQSLGKVISSLQDIESQISKYCQQQQ